MLVIYEFIYELFVPEGRNDARRACRTGMFRSVKEVYFQLQNFSPIKRTWGINMSVKIMLVDSHVIVREGICKLIENDNIEIVAEANTGFECLEILNKIRPNILLIDYKLPDMEPVTIIEEVKKKVPNLKIIILTGNYDKSLIARSIEIGVKGFLSKECNSNELKKAIGKVYNDEVYIQNNLLSQFNTKNKMRNLDKNKIDSLTNRELEVLIQIANGMFNKEIAMLLNISERTVKNHVSNIFKKIEVSDRTQAAVFAIKNNLVNI